MNRVPVKYNSLKGEVGVLTDFALKHRTAAAWESQQETAVGRVSQQGEALERTRSYRHTLLAQTFEWAKAYLLEAYCHKETREVRLPHLNLNISTTAWIQRWIDPDTNEERYDLLDIALGMVESDFPSPRAFAAAKDDLRRTIQYDIEDWWKEGAYAFAGEDH